MVHNDVRGRRLTAEEIAGQVFAMLSAGTETTGNALANTARALLEGMRYDTPVPGLFRSATRDTSVAGTAIPMGAKLFLLFASANRDEERHARAAEFDVPPPGPARHSSFGHGIHYCIGAQLAKLELAIALDVLARRFPDLRFAPDAPLACKPVNQFRALQSLWLEA